MNTIPRKKPIPFVLAVCFFLLATCAAQAKVKQKPQENERCQILRDMSKAWANVELNSQQELAKRELVRWYIRYCRRKDVPL